MPEASGSRQNASEGPSQARDGGGHWWGDQGRMDMTHRQIERGWTMNRRIDMKHRQIERGWMLNRTEDWKQISKCMNKK